MKPTNERSQDSVLLQRLTQTVLDNLENEQFGVEDLSEQVGMSRSRLHRKLKLLKGQSVSQFIREVRLKEAMKLLQNDVATISEIAYRVGFGSPSYFYKCFQKFYGYPPGETKRIFHNKKNNKPEVRVHPTSNQRAFIYKIAGACMLTAFIGIMSFYLLKKENTPSSIEKSIAVLPFTNLSDDEENRYFADGIVEDLLNRLSVVKEFKVISRTSSDTYRERGMKTVPQIAIELGVSYIVEGSVQKYGNHARITVQLIDANNDHHLWAQTFDRNMADIFKIQSEIAIRVASELNTILTTQQTIDLKKNRTENLKAFEWYQLGRFHWNKRTDEGYATSIDYFEKALAEDPEYGLAYAGLADTYNLMAIQGWIEQKEDRDKAVALALKALDLDERLAEAHNVLASIYTYIDFNWEAAERNYQRAIELNPNYATAHQYYSEHLSIVGKHEEARQHINKALELDPLSFVIRYASVKLYYNCGLFKEALTHNQRSHELNPDHRWSAQYDFEINYQLGNDSAALKGFKQLGRITGDYDPNKADSVYQVSGLDGMVRWGIEFINWNRGNYGKAEWYGLLGEDEKAIDMLEKASDEGNINPEFAFKYVFKNLHAHPRFIPLKNKIGLPHVETSSY